MIPYIIRSRLTATAIRNGYYNPYTGKFLPSFPQNLEYSLPPQNNNIVYKHGISYRNNKNENILNNNHLLFITPSRQTIFDTKKTILNTFTSILYDDQTFFVTENKDIRALFIQPQSETYDTTTLGVSYTKKTDDQITDLNIYVYNIINNNNIVISLIYASSLAHTEVIIKHPVLPNNLIAVSLPAQDTNSILG